jgi:hypothetical protein
MMTEIKRFIELRDVLSLRLSCKNCGADLLVSPQEYSKRRSKAAFLSVCPICASPWAEVSGSTCEPTIAKFIDAFITLSQCESVFPVGFSLSLEVKCEKLPTKEGINDLPR